MKVLLALAALLGLAAAACGGGGDGDGSGPAEDHLHLTAPDSGKTFDIANGGEIMIVLSSNISTGYSWGVVDPMPAQLEMIGEPRYVPPGSTQPVPGAPGEQVFTFKATKSGTAELKLAYSRPFEPGSAPERTFSATIIVR
jgi:predicted secreted protein